ncbi:putative lipoprotein [Streptomyces albus]|uniref:Putative lipoprotein n=1 Tax=Streptomyces albus (strain ATCC 21838 / DSM 41398 / FERM P-419 / JCM 4703 / NBRC 107858) TaxID=1081613 RepID=A0A0B5EQ94_STRA4|nr:putative lipoprotein [Streptomyces albus]AOU79243.1 putative lipoprotein [Streptomyces albus]AYN34974.1 hypothetical protein DUI70_4476 [Streptomyces albus]
MKTRHLRRLALSVAAAAALTSVAACGSSDGDGTKDDKAVDKPADNGSEGNSASALTALRTVDESTEAADSAKVESTFSMGEVLSMETKGELSWADGTTGAMNITYTGGQMAQQMEQAGSSSIDARYLPDEYYAKMGEPFARQAGGKHWIRYSYEDLEDLAGSSGAYMKDQLQNSTPNQSVKLLLASGDVRRVGEEEVRGEDTTHYRGKVEVAELAERGSNLDKDQLADLKKQLQASGITTETIDIWVDDKNLMVKKTEAGDTAKGRLTTTAFYSDYGIHVTAEAPPADDTVDFKELMKQQQ